MKKSYLLRLAFGLALCLAAVPAWAYYGSSNFGYGGYPRPSCTEPNPPYSNDEYSWSRFKSQVLEYESCINEYVDAAANDQRTIADQANEAVRSYNRFIQALKMRM